MSKATFGAGCFWGIEEIFRKLKGITDAKVGYSGGKLKNPTYENVCSGKTEHVEVVQIEFDSKVVSYKELLNVFWESHDPTSIDKQGPDKGSQYRSIIFYHNEVQKKLAKNSKRKAQKRFKKKIVTQIKKFSKFYKAEEYHQKYFRKHKILKLLH
jgi:peptide-methionine (S)-S-oxide reductase